MVRNYQPAITGPLVPCLFILMEYADCGNVMDYVIPPDDDDDDDEDKPKKWLSEHEIWTIMFETCMCLQHLHEYSIVHRDIKPGNLLMSSLHTRHRIDFEDLELYDTNYRIVISDLGQSEFMDQRKRAPRTGNTGTLGFAAPELILNGEDFGYEHSQNEDEDENENDQKWDESVDIWSLGHLLYFLTFSRWPYEETNCDDERELYLGIMDGKYKLLIPKHNGYRSPTIINMIDELCQIDIDKRPSLNWTIDAISRILKSHQYITISSTSSSSNLHGLQQDNDRSISSESRSRTPPRKSKTKTCTNKKDDLLEPPDLKRARSKSEEILISPQFALPPPPGIKPDLSLYPVVKYEPQNRHKNKNKHVHKHNNGNIRNRNRKNEINKTSSIYRRRNNIKMHYRDKDKFGNLLRRRHKRSKSSLLKFDDDDEDEKDEQNHLLRMDEHKVDTYTMQTSDKTELNALQRVSRFEMTMYDSVKVKLYDAIMQNGIFKLSMCLMIKIQLILQYIHIDNNEYIVQIYICICAFY